MPVGFASCEVSSAGGDGTAVGGKGAVGSPRSQHDISATFLSTEILGEITAGVSAVTTCWPGSIPGPPVLISIPWCHEITPEAAVAERLVCLLPPPPPKRRTGFTRGFSHVGTVPNDAAGRWVFLGISRFPRPFIPALLHCNKPCKRRWAPGETVVECAAMEYNNFRAPAVNFFVTIRTVTSTCLRLNLAQCSHECVDIRACCTGKRELGRNEKESAMTFVWDPSHHSPGEISENHENPKSGWPDRKSNPGLRDVDIFRQPQPSLHRCSQSADFTPAGHPRRYLTLYWLVVYADSNIGTLYEGSVTPPPLPRKPSDLLHTAYYTWTLLHSVRKATIVLVMWPYVWTDNNKPKLVHLIAKDRLQTHTQDWRGYRLFAPKWVERVERDGHNTGIAWLREGGGGFRVSPLFSQSRAVNQRGLGAPLPSHKNGFLELDRPTKTRTSNSTLGSPQPSQFQKSPAATGDEYPSCDSVLNGRKYFYPEGITITETVAEVKLRDLGGS
ncbi:hypothetical protein PR048_010253 [Dryococelus australis]|uniref:Uncharacterized protein n=1 Tax=Dryococelus australis TaxID=614101 RepID=A0ABQ9I272_9NEOP|nr:hypothetical protein PR048_010253 [Dryococelus australis]